MDPLSISCLTASFEMFYLNGFFEPPPHGFSVGRKGGQSRHRVDSESQTDVSHNIREETWSGWEGKKKAKAKHKNVLSHLSQNVQVHKEDPQKQHEQVHE